MEIIKKLQATGKSLITFSVGVLAFWGIVLLLLWSVTQVTKLAIELLPEGKAEKSQTELNAERRDECIKNGFGYEWVKKPWYIGVRCTTPPQDKV